MTSEIKIGDYVRPYKGRKTSYGVSLGDLKLARVSSIRNGRVIVTVIKGEGRCSAWYPGYSRRAQFRLNYSGRYKPGSKLTISGNTLEVLNPDEIDIATSDLPSVDSTRVTLSSNDLLLLL